MASKALSVCFAIVRWAPVVFITAVVVWSYYAYVVQMCLFTVDNIAEKVFYLLMYHPLLALFAWSYWKTIFTPVGIIPKEFHLSRSEAERFESEENEEVQREMLARFARNLPVQCRTSSGSVRYCEKCKCIKPDRAHHCSVCGICVLKMDHHCPWVNNCVNFTNYKFFILFLGYALIYCLYVAATSLQYFIRFWTSAAGGSATLGKFHVLFLFFAAVMFSISLISLFGYHLFLNIGGSNGNMGSLHIVFLFFAGIMFAISVLSLFGYHMYLVSVNRSTLESFRAPIFRTGPDKDGFSLGRRGNFNEIFGDDKKYWCLPIFTSLGDGVSYPTRVQEPPSYSSMASTPNNPNSTPATPTTATTTIQADSTVQPPSSFGDGVTYPIRTVDEDYDRLLSDRQRWMEEGDDGTNDGYDNQATNLHNPM